MKTEINDNDNNNKEMVEFEERWSLQLDEIYKMALQFYKEKNGSKALTLSYNDRLMLLALTKQIAHGKYDPSLVPDNGLFDVIGNNRRKVWESLGDMSKSAAMIQFVNIINSICPLFASVVEAHKIEKEERERLIKAELEEKELLAKTKQEEELKKQEELLQKQIAQELLIRNALNQQTYNQFMAYAQLQHPNNKSLQDALISQLQEQHFLQYMQQVYNQHNSDNNKAVVRSDALYTSSTTANLAQPLLPSNGVVPAVKECSLPQTPLECHDAQRKSDIGSEELVDFCKKQIEENATSNHIANSEESEIEVASEWMRKDIKLFKESLRAENEAVIKVGSGELVTVRVPTQNGTTLFWEFATDSLDIGFGLSFEWGKVEEKQTDEKEQKEEKRVDIIIPVARAQSHVEVQCGSHKYPGSGVYLLIFDNSYSLWRSKSIYYRVFYSQ